MAYAVMDLYSIYLGHDSLSSWVKDKALDIAEDYDIDIELVPESVLNITFNSGQRGTASLKKFVKKLLTDLVDVKDYIRDYDKLLKTV